MMKIRQLFRKKVENTPINKDIHKQETLLAAGSVGDLFKQGPYYDQAEPYMDDLWNNLI
jgi:hypothetical protein